ncbi:hypothetical protein [Kitasatospora sp. NBC_00315]|uniref:hypothetical protein n=1 Tax=Kitasatospora sp. NBC_00315 TaxID=2975963 RepID=UPI00324E6363
MKKAHHKTHASMEDGEASRFAGADQHGWSPDIDAEEQHDNDSAHRSFHPDTYAPEPGPGRTVSKQEEQDVPGDTVESTGRRAEDTARKHPDKHTSDTGPQGPSQRPSGSRTASAHTGVDPQEPSGPTSAH